MARRNQARRRRTYGRRQHEVRERQPGERPTDGWQTVSDAEVIADWQGSDGFDERTTYGESFGGFSR